MSFKGTFHRKRQPKFIPQPAIAYGVLEITKDGLKFTPDNTIDKEYDWQGFEKETYKLYNRVNGM